MDATEDTEVRRVDQEAINEFGRLTNKLKEINEDVEAYTKKLEELSDASDELMLEGADNVKLMLGEAFMEVDEDFATEYCDKECDRLRTLKDGLEKEKDGITARQKELKESLYSRFGNSINLEEK